MAETRKITIEIVGKTTDTGNNQAEKPVDENGQLKKNLTYLLHPIKTLEAQTLGKSVLINQAYQSAKNSIINAVEWTHNRYFSLKENYLGQMNYNNIMTSINKVASLGTSAISGAITGSALGPVGAVAGAVIGTVGWGVNEIMNYQQRMSNTYQLLNSNNFSTNFAQVRAGLINGGRGTEN